MTALLDELIAAAERGYEYFIDVYDKKAMACIRATWRYKHHQRQRIEAAERKGERMGKVRVSQEWTPEERQKVSVLLQDAINAVEGEHDKEKAHCMWMSPYRQSLTARENDLHMMLRLVLEADAAFLEINRGNFKDYIV